MPKLKIAVNTRFLLKDKLEGVGHFADETLSRITRSNPDVDFHFIFDREPDPSFIYDKNVIPHVVGIQARHPLLWYLWFERSVPKVLRKIDPDLFVSPDNYLSTSTDVKSHLVLHDLAFDHFPDQMPKMAVRFLKHFTPKYIRKASRIATVSEFTKNDIANRYGCDKKKIDVVYNGSSSHFKPNMNGSAEKIKGELTNGQDFFVFVGSLNPRKNIDGLLIAFDRFKDNTGLPHKLVLAGRKAWKYQEIEQIYNNMVYKNDVVFTGHLSTEKLAKLLPSATALTYVSHFEGFGIPLIEAMASHIPVITANNSSQKEVAGNAALLVDSKTPEQLAEAMSKIAKDESLRNELVEKGIERVKVFSWENTAKAYWNSILKTLEN